MNTASTALQGKWALVTGASSGLGTDFARQLAMRHCNLILVARRADRLNDVQQEITNQYGVDVMTIPMDLGEPDAPQRLYDATHEAGHAVDVLINNAGFGLHGHFIDIPWERERAMLELDIIALMHLTKLFGQDMVARKSGYILQIASVGAYQPTPTYASYSAAKTFVLYSSQAIRYELRKSGVSCTVLSPGITATEFLAVAGQERTLYQRLMMMKSADVARIGIEAMLKRRASIVPGWLNALLAGSTRLIPHGLSAAIASRLMTY
jgi:hypothetical protein